MIAALFILVVVFWALLPALVAIFGTRAILNGEPVEDADHE